MSDQPLAIVPKDPESLKSFQTLAGLGKDDATITLSPSCIREIASYEGEALHSFIRGVARFSSILLQPAFIKFMDDFKAAKERDGEYFGYSNFDKACELVGYSSKQVRNIAKGTVTPVRHKTPEEIQTSAERKKLNDKIEADRVSAAREAERQAEIHAEKQNSAKEAVKEEAEIKQPAPVKSLVRKDPVAAKTQQLLDESVLIIREFINVFTGELNKEQRAARKKAVNYLNLNHGGIADLPFEGPKEKAEGASA